MAAGIPDVAMGWKGYLGVGGTANLLPYTSFDLTEKDNTIPAADIHGGGIAGQTLPEFATEINAADGPVTYDGSINGNIYAGSGSFGTAFRGVIERAVDYSERLKGFTEDFPLIVSPGGATVEASVEAFQYPGDDTIDSILGGKEGSLVNSIHRCVVGSMSINGGTGGLSTWSGTFISTTRKNATSVTPTATSLEFETTGPTLGTDNPVPWHKIKFDINDNIGDADLESRVTAFTINIDNQPVPVMTFNRARTARDVYISQLIATGTFTYYGIADSPGDAIFKPLNKVVGSPSGTPGVVATFGVESAGGTDEIVLEMPFLVLDLKPIPSGGPNELIYRQVNYRALAGAAGSGAINLK